jgi:hypothetical protein
MHEFHKNQSENFHRENTGFGKFSSDTKEAVVFGCNKGKT